MQVSDLAIGCSDSPCPWSDAVRYGPTFCGWRLPVRASAVESKFAQPGCSVRMGLVIEAHWAASTALAAIIGYRTGFGFLTA